MKLLADTSALLALHLRDEANHEAAAGFVRREPGARFVMTELILGELATRLAARVGPRPAAEVARALLASGRYEVLFSNAVLVGEALDLMEKHSDKRLSLTDCTSFALMRRLEIDTAFSFDRDFRDCGFAMLP